MIFNYEEVSSRVKRPIIPIFLKSESRFVIYKALIDSGSDYCIFSIDLAHLLEINLSSSDNISFIGVGKEEIEGLWGLIEIRIGKISYKTKAIFAEISDFGHGILGQKGFFDHFDVRLSYKRQVVEIQPYRSLN